jgi:hypothetical protein
MNQFVEDKFIESLQRLALGLEPIDAERRTRIAHPIEVTLDAPPPGLRRPRLERHNSTRYALRYFPGAIDQVDLRFPLAAARPAMRRLAIPIPPAASLTVRFFDPARRFVPRRLRIPIRTAPEADNQPYTHRIRRPSLFPGAAYDVSATATGLRGRVLRQVDGQDIGARWVRVEAALPGTEVVVGRAHGDDRGEFLLLVQSGAIPVGDLTDPLPIQITIFAPDPLPPPASPDDTESDPLWDLPIEEVPAPGLPDPVSEGEARPTGYIAKASQAVNMVLGKLRSDIDAFNIT